MAEIISEDMFGDILKSGPSQFIYPPKEGEPEIVVVFQSSISITNPGDEDVLGKIWDPPTEDANGNPIIDKFGPNKGNPMQPWAKVEAQVTKGGSPSVLTFGRKNGAFLREFGIKMNEEDITNQDLKGTKWSIQRTGRYNWSIEYLGREESDSSTPKEEKKENKDLESIKSSLVSLKSGNPDVAKGVDKNQLMQNLVFITGLKPDAIKSNWDKLIKEKIIEEKDNTVKVL